MSERTTAESIEELRDALAVLGETVRAEVEEVTRRGLLRIARLIEDAREDT